MTPAEQDPPKRVADPDPPRPPIMPATVRAGQVIGLVEITGGLRSAMDVYKLAEEFAADIATLLPILDAGELLGLVKVEKGDVFLTEQGKKFQKLSKNKIAMLKEPLSKMEPFATAVELASKQQHVSARQVAEALQERDIRWHHSPETNEALVKDLLIRWAIYAGLLAYNGKSGVFQKA